MVKRNISTQLSLIVSTCTVLTFATLIYFVTAVSYQSTVASQEKNIATLNLQTSKVAENTLNSALQTAKIFSDQRTVVNALRYNSSSAIPTQDFISALNGNKMLDAIALFDSDGKILRYVDSTKDKNDLSEKISSDILNAMRSASDHFSKKTIQHQSTGDILVQISTPIADPVSEKIIGGVSVYLNWSKFSDIYITPVVIGNQGYIAVTDSQGVMLDLPYSFVPPAMLVLPAA